MTLARVIRSRRARTPRSTGVQLGEDQARALILRGAAGVFAKHGMRAASVQNILAAAGVSRRTFYRFYTSKEDVAFALYRVGTEELLANCRRIVAQTADPIARVQGFVEAHLHNARTVGRLVFVLGGEAQRQESALHARRLEVHAALADLLMASQPQTQGKTRTKRRAKSIDPLLYRGMILGLEGVTRAVLQEGNEGRNVTDAAIQRARAVLMRMATAVLAGAGPNVAPMPMLS